ncbi:MAG: quinone-dependent dihydroorotate dehydrogenase [Pseudohongiellaceae bacterium]
MYRVIRFFLFLLPAELSHHLGLKGLKLVHRLGLGKLFAARLGETPLTVMGLQFPNPVGLAAGLDKNGDYVDALGALGFGFIELGTVTPRPQPGNAAPRLFRLVGQEALINRMGFNNKGVVHLVERLKTRKYKGIVGVNIGKNFSTPVENALDDYLYCLRAVFPVADYIVVNLSSPNTPGLRSLQFGEQLENLLAALTAEQARLQKKLGRRVPLLLKIAPDLQIAEIHNIAETVNKFSLAGVVATNTTTSREGIGHTKLSQEAGGLSGRPLLEKSSQVLAELESKLAPEVALIGVGGIMDEDGARMKAAAGADLVQIYSGFVFKGPALIRAAAMAYKPEAGGA